MASDIEDLKAASKAAESSKTGEPQAVGVARIKEQYPKLDDEQAERLWRVESGQNAPLGDLIAASRKVDADLRDQAVDQLMSASARVASARPDKKPKPAKAEK